MLLIIAGILFVCWLLGVTLFKVTAGLIHIVLVIALVAIVVHFVSGTG